MCQVQAGAYVSLLTPGETKYSDCHQGKTTTYILHVVSITTHTHDRHKSIGEKETKKRTEDKGKERKENTAGYWKTYITYCIAGDHTRQSHPLRVESVIQQFVKSLKNERVIYQVSVPCYGWRRKACGMGKCQNVKKSGNVRYT